MSPDNSTPGTNGSVVDRSGSIDEFARIPRGLLEVQQPTPRCPSPANAGSFVRNGDFKRILEPPLSPRCGFRSRRTHHRRTHQPWIDEYAGWRRASLRAAGTRGCAESDPPRSARKLGRTWRGPHCRACTKSPWPWVAADACPPLRLEIQDVPRLLQQGEGCLVDR